MKQQLPSTFGLIGIGAHAQQWVSNFMNRGMTVLDALPDDMIAIYDLIQRDNEKMDTTKDDSQDDEQNPPTSNDDDKLPPLQNDDMETDPKQDTERARMIVLKSLCESCVVFDTDIASMKEKCLAESGGPDYLAIREVKLMEAFKKVSDKPTVWIPAPTACIIINSNFANKEEITDVILDIGLPCFGNSNEDQIAFLDTPINMRLACFTNDSMSFIQSGDNKYPERKSSHTSLVFVDIVKPKKSAIVSVTKFSIDPHHNKLNDAADRLLLQRLSCIIKKAMRFGKYRCQFSYCDEFDPFHHDSLCIIKPPYYQQDGWSCWIHCLAFSLIVIWTEIGCEPSHIDARLSILTAKDAIDTIPRIREVLRAKSNNFLQKHLPYNNESLPIISFLPRGLEVPPK